MKYLFIFIILFSVSDLSHSTQDCHDGQNKASKLLNDAKFLNQTLIKNECAEKELISVEGFFNGWISRMGRIQGFLDEAAMYQYTPEVCLNFSNYMDYVTERFYNLVDDVFQECFGLDQ